MKAARYLLVLSLLALLTQLAFTQSKKANKAFATFNAGEYYTAIDQFKDAYQQTTDKKEKLNIAFHIAECYRKIDNSPQAALWYGKVIAKDYENPLSILYYADALRMNQNYEEVFPFWGLWIGYQSNGGSPEHKNSAKSVPTSPDEANPLSCR